MVISPVLMIGDYTTLDILRIIIIQERESRSKQTSMNARAILNAAHVV